jgi:spermidine/putrescine transport system ATP-binding protein/putrescine transport system ATP-binding protein
VQERDLPGLAIGEELRMAWRPEDARIVIR